MSSLFNDVLEKQEANAKAEGDSSTFESFLKFVGSLPLNAKGTKATTYSLYYVPISYKVGDILVQDRVLPNAHRVRYTTDRFFYDKSKKEQVFAVEKYNLAGIKDFESYEKLTGSKILTDSDKNIITEIGKYTFNMWKLFRSFLFDHENTKLPDGTIKKAVLPDGAPKNFKEDIYPKLKIDSTKDQYLVNALLLLEKTDSAFSLETSMKVLNISNSDLYDALSSALRETTGKMSEAEKEEWLASFYTEAIPGAVPKNIIKISISAESPKPKRTVSFLTGTQFVQECSTSKIISSVPELTEEDVAKVKDLYALSNWYRVDVFEKERYTNCLNRLQEVDNLVKMANDAEIAKAESPVDVVSGNSPDNKVVDQGSALKFDDEVPF